MIFITKEEDLDLTFSKRALYFYGSWMPYHKKMLTMIGKMEEKYPDMKFFAIDVDAFKGICKRFNIDSVPMVPSGTCLLIYVIVSCIILAIMEIVMVTKKKAETSVPTVEETPDQIWEKIQNITLDIFALPDQKVHAYFKPVPIEPSKLYLSYSVPAALPSLEDALKFLFTQGILNTQYEVGTSDRFVTVQQKKEE
jgi:thiol-disulfide isomerase/thioredoxin